MTRDEAERITERIRVALDRVSSSWADLGERITEAYQRRADLALGYESWSAYAEAELKPSTGLAAEVRRQLVGMLSQAGMSTRAIAPTVGAPRSTVHDDIKVSGNRTPEPTGTTEAIDPLTGEVFDADRKPSFIDPPASVTGLDGKSYTRPTTKKEEAPVPPRTPVPQPTKYGPRPKHNQIISKAIVSANGICIALNEIAELDQSLTCDEAARYADDLAQIIRSLKRIQSLIKKEV